MHRDWVVLWKSRSAVSWLEPLQVVLAFKAVGFAGGNDSDNPFAGSVAVADEQDAKGRAKAKKNETVFF